MTDDDCLLVIVTYLVTVLPKSWLLIVTPAGEVVTSAVPVPCMLMVWLPAGASSVIVSRPVRPLVALIALGLKLTVIVQMSGDGPTVYGEVETHDPPVTANSAVAEPSVLVTPTLEMTSGVALLLVTVTVSIVAEICPATSGPKESVAGPALPLGVGVAVGWVHVLVAVIVGVRVLVGEAVGVGVGPATPTA